MNKITMNECSKRKLDELYVVIHAIKDYYLYISWY